MISRANDPYDPYMCILILTSVASSLIQELSTMFSSMQYLFSGNQNFNSAQ